MPALTFAQDDFWYQLDFPLEEFAQRRGRIFEKIPFHHSWWRQYVVRPLYAQGLRSERRGHRLDGPYPGLWLLHQLLIGH